MDERAHDEGAGDERVQDQAAQPSEAVEAPGSAGVGLAGGMETGPLAGAGPDPPEDLIPPIPGPGQDQSEGGPVGSMDSSLGDVEEAGD